MAAAGAVVIGGYVNGLGLVRALAARRIPAAVVTTKPFDIAHRSRWCVAHAAVSGIEERPEALAELLERRAGDWPGWALLPTNDEAMAALAEHHDRLSSLYRVVSPPAEVARHFLDKNLMLEVARSVGADVPHDYGPAVQATAARGDLRFPVLVKPLAGYRFQARFGSKLFVAQDGEELRRAIRRVGEAGIPAQVVDCVPGADDRIYQHCTYVDARGEPLGSLTMRKLRQSPPFFGVARVAEIPARPPDLREPTVEILRRIGHRGIATAEFKLDPRDGSVRFIEVNGRSVNFNPLLRRAGLDLAGLAWADHVEGSAERARPNGWPGVWINLHADLLHAMLRRREQPLSARELIAPYRRPRIEAVWSAADPLPFLAQWSRTAGEAASELRRRGPARTARRPRGTSRRRGPRARRGARRR